MKTFLLFMFLTPITLFSQQLSGNGDTLATSNGMKFYPNMNIKLGTGTLPSGDFKFITTSQSSWLNVMGGNTEMYRGDRKFSGHTFTVKKIRKEGTKKRGYTYYLVLGGGNIVNYECDIENAMAFNEVIVPDEFKKKVAATFEIKQTLSVSDELIKLKKLYSDSLLTKDEYELQRKKLLL